MSSVLRDKFEQWYKHSHTSACLTRSGKGYIDNATRVAWRAFQEGARNATDAEILMQALSALVLLVDGDHDDDCRFKSTPVDECPTCCLRHAKVAKEAIKALKKRKPSVLFED